MRVSIVVLVMSLLLSACGGPGRREPVLQGLAMLDHRVPDRGNGLSGHDSAIPQYHAFSLDENGALRASINRDAIEAGDGKNLAVLDAFERYKAANAADRKSIRDKIGCVMLTTIKHYHEGVSDDVYEITAQIETMFDALGGTLGVLSGVTGGRHDKAIFGAAAGGLLGLRNSVSKNVLAEQTKFAILLQMDAQRLKKEAEILRNMKKPDDQYPLSRLCTDLYDYYAAGSLKDAVAKLNEAAQAAKKKAEEDRNQER